MTNSYLIVGGYKIQIGEHQYWHLPMYHKPSFTHRFFMKHLLGIEWVEYGQE